MEIENPYLKLRNEKIARNEARLQELGLHKPTRQSTLSSKIPNLAKNEVYDDKCLPLRRSSRKRSSPSSVTDAPVERETSPRRSKKSPKTVVVANQTHSVSPHSARAMELNVLKLIHGDTVTPGFLGKKMTHTGKAYVMDESARLAVSESISRLSFNKYSGVQEWGNNVMFLWVNLGAPNSDLVNAFFHGGRQVSWFGGSRMNEETPVIQKMRQVGLKTDLEQSSSDGIIFWCRTYISDQKTFSPYVCLGRLSVSVCRVRTAIYGATNAILTFSYCHSAG